MRLKFRRKMVLYYLCILIFIPPRFLYSVDSMKFLTSALAGARYVLSFMAVIYFFTTRKNQQYLKHIYVISYIIAILLQIVALRKNGSIYLTAALSCFTFIGFTFGNIILYNKDSNKLLLAYRNFLGFCLIMHMIMILVLPNGIAPIVTEGAQVYFMGSKNGLTPYAVFFFLAEYLILQNTYVQSKKIIRYIGIVAVMLTVFSIINASSAYLGTMIVIDVYIFITYVIYAYKNLERLFQRVYSIAIVIFVFAFFYVVVVFENGNNAIFGILTSLLGKDTTFSGRRAIWARAIILITQNPLWGIGLDVQYDVWENNKYVYSAHNMFLDYGVKYGCLSLFFIVLCLIIVFGNAIKVRKNEETRMCIVICAALILATMFEALETYYPTWATVLFTYLVTQKYKQQSISKTAVFNNEYKRA